MPTVTMMRGSVDPHDHSTDEPPPGRVSVTHDEHGSVVTLHGDIDAALRDEAGLTMAAVLAHGGPVLVEMSRVTFIDSSGLAFVIQLHRLGVEDESQPCTLLNPPDLVLEMLEMVGLAGEIPLAFSPGDTGLGDPWSAIRVADAEDLATSTA